MSTRTDPDKPTVTLVAIDMLDWMGLLQPRVAASNVVADTRLPTLDEYRELVAEAALGYFSDDELRDRFSLSKELWHDIRTHAAFKRDVLAVRREQDGNDTAIRTLARRSTREAVDTLRNIITDKETLSGLDGEDDEPVEVVTAGTRIKAIEQLRHLAGLGAQSVAPGAGGGGVLLQINTNLGLNNDLNGGRYTITAREVPADGGGRVIDDVSDLL